MTDDVATASPGDLLDEVMDLMKHEQVRRIPIVDERGTLLGVVSQADLLVRGQNVQKAGETIERISQPYGKHAQ